MTASTHHGKPGGEPRGDRGVVRGAWLSKGGEYASAESAGIWSANQLVSGRSSLTSLLFSERLD
jgi:hypothetical protein